MDIEKQTASSWLERVEDIINVLDGSSVGEIELTEGGTEIIIRRNPGLLVTATEQTVGASTGTSGSNRSAKADTTIPVIAPLTGVYYSAASPSTPAFVNIGDVIQVGHVVALIEAMKVFNEITAEVSGRVVSMVATNGAVVQKGDVILRLEPV